MTNKLIKNGALYLLGVCGGDWFGGGFTETQVRDALDELSGAIDVRLNSPGGNAWQGIGIHNALLDYDGEITLYVEALAASAASLFAMAADKIIMRPGSLMMIHDPSTITYGPAKDHEKSADFLRKMAASGATIYSTRSGKPVSEIREIMEEETWYTAEEAVAEGFADHAENAANDESPQMRSPVFDYSIFKNSPEQLRELTPPECGQQTAALVAAIAKEARMSGNTNVAKGNKPASSNTPAAATMAADPTRSPASAVPAATQTTAPAAATATDTPQMSERETFLAIGEQCRSAGLSAEATNRVLLGAETLDGAKDMIIAELSTPVDAPAPTASVGRDAGETMRAGVMCALVAQFTGGTPEDQGREYMSFSIPELAAQVSGQDGARLRSFADRERVLMSAFAPHTTGDFPGIFSNALNKSLLERYEQAEPTYRRISRQRNFRDFRPHPQIRAGDFPKLQRLSEAGEIKHGTFGESKETAMVEAYAVQFAITRQMMVNDDMGAIQEVINSSGDEVANFEERRFYEFKASAKLADNKAVFHADHNNLKSPGTAITVAAISAGRAAMRKQTSVDKKRINIQAKILLVSPDKETEAEQLVASITANESVKVNPFSGKLEVISPAEMTGNAWELYADPSRAANWVWGLLDGYEAPRLTFDEPFGSQGLKGKLEHDFGVGAVDYRAAYQNVGA